MAFGSPRKPKTSLRVFLMLAALVLAAFLGGSLGLVWQNVSWFDDEPEQEVLTAEVPST